MRPARRRLARPLLIGLLTLPLLETGACVQIAQDSIINGFFDAATPMFIERAQDALSPPVNAGETDGDGGP